MCEKNKIRHKRMVVDAIDYCRKRCQAGEGYCPDSGIVTPCKRCSGVNEVIMHWCQICNACSIWD